MGMQPSIPSVKSTRLLRVVWEWFAVTFKTIDRINNHEKQESFRGKLPHD